MKENLERVGGMIDGTILVYAILFLNKILSVEFFQLQ